MFLVEIKNTMISGDFYKTKGFLLRVWIIFQKTLCFGKSHQINLLGISFHHQISAAYHSGCLIKHPFLNSGPIPRISGAGLPRSENRCPHCFQAGKVPAQKPGKGQGYQPLFYLKEQVTGNCWFNGLSLIGTHSSARSAFLWIKNPHKNSSWQKLQGKIHAQRCPPRGSQFL